MVAVSRSPYIAPDVQAFVDANILPAIGNLGSAGSLSLYILDDQLGWSEGDPFTPELLTMLLGLASLNSVPYRFETDPVALAGDLTPEAVTIASAVQVPGTYRIELEGTYTSTGTIDGYELPPITGTGITEVGPSTSLVITGLGTSELRVGYVATVESDGSGGALEVNAAVSTVVPADGASLVATTIVTPLATGVLP